MLHSTSTQMIQRCIHCKSFGERRLTQSFIFGKKDGIAQCCFPPCDSYRIRSAHSVTSSKSACQLYRIIPFQRVETTKVCCTSHNRAGNWDDIIATAINMTPKQCKRSVANLLAQEVPTHQLIEGGCDLRFSDFGHNDSILAAWRTDPLNPCVSWGASQQTWQERTGIEKIENWHTP